MVLAYFIIYIINCWYNAVFTAKQNIIMLFDFHLRVCLSVSVSVCLYVCVSVYLTLSLIRNHKNIYMVYTI